MALAPGRYPTYRNGCHDAALDFGSRAFDLLLMRMEALRLEPGEARCIEPTVFGDLAKTCATCASKTRCESDFVYESAGTVTRDWEDYCPNATILNAMAELPWFGKPGRGPAK